MDKIRLYRKVPNSDGSPNRYRVAYRLGGGYKIVSPEGKVFFHNPDHWQVRIEGEEELGAVFLGDMAGILERYDVIEETHSTES